MKAKLEFDLDEPCEKKELDRMLSATNAYLALFNIDEACRAAINSECLEERDVDKLCEKIMDIITEHVDLGDLE